MKKIIIQLFFIILPALFTSFASADGPLFDRKMIDKNGNEISINPLNGDRAITRTAAQIKAEKDAAAARSADFAAPGGASFGSASELPKVPLNFKATTDVPGVTQAQQELPFLPEYIRRIYIFALSAAGIIAVFQFVRAGFKWMFSEVVTSKQDALDELKQTTYGLVLLLATVLILNTLGILGPGGTLAQQTTQISKNTSGATPAKKSCPQGQVLIEEECYSPPKLFADYNQILDEAAKIARDTGSRDYAKEAQGCATAVQYYQGLVLQGIGGGTPQEIQRFNTYNSLLTRYANCLNNAMKELGTASETAYQNFNQKQTTESKITYLKANRALSEAALLSAQLRNDVVGIKMYIDNIKEIDRNLKNLGVQ